MLLELERRLSDREISNIKNAILFIILLTDSKLALDKKYKEMKNVIIMGGLLFLREKFFSLINMG
jgi:hypothetical protein